MESFVILFRGVSRSIPYIFKMCCCTVASVEDVARGGILNVASLASSSDLEEASRLCRVRDENLPRQGLLLAGSWCARSCAVHILELKLLLSLS